MTELRKSQVPGLRARAGGCEGGPGGTLVVPRQRVSLPQQQLLRSADSGGSGDAELHSSAHYIVYEMGTGGKPDEGAWALCLCHIL